MYIHMYMYMYMYMYSSGQKKVPVPFVLNDDCVVGNYYATIMYVCVLCSVEVERITQGTSGHVCEGRAQC